MGLRVSLFCFKLKLRTSHITSPLSTSSSYPPDITILHAPPAPPNMPFSGGGCTCSRESWILAHDRTSEAKNRASAFKSIVIVLGHGFTHLESQTSPTFTPSREPNCFLRKTISTIRCDLRAKKPYVRIPLSYRACVKVCHCKGECDRSCAILGMQGRRSLNLGSDVATHESR